MRSLRLLIFAIIGAALCTSAAAQDRDVRAPSSSAPPAATTGAAPRAPAGQAPVGHRQPTTTEAPSRDPTGPMVSPYDQKIDRDLNICRNC